MSHLYETEEFEALGSGGPLGENETTILFRDLEHELELLTQRYHVPPEDLEQLFQVVQNMFEYMDTNKEALDRVEAEKDELEDLWKQEKDKLRSAQRRKLELECRLEEERMKIESEKTTLEKDKVALQTRVKQLGEHKENAEQELQRIKDRSIKEEQMRKELLEQYKKQADLIKTQSLRRMGSMKSLNRGRRLLPNAPDRRPPTSSLSTSLRVPHTEPLEDSIRSDTFLEVSDEDPRRSFHEESSPVTQYRQSTPSGNTSGMSLQEELAGADDNKLEDSITSQNGEFEESAEFDEEEVWPGYEDDVTEEVMESILTTPMRAEVEMLQREKELWVEEREKMEEQLRATREQREKIERQNAQTQVEVKQLKDNLKKLQDEMADVRAERDEILGHYLEQPFEEYCITRKELNELLKKHQKTAIELEQEKEEKEKLQRLLASKRSFFERFKEKWRKMFTKPTTDELVQYKTNNMELSKIRTPSPLPVPLVRSLAPVMDDTLKVEKGWLMAHDSHMTKDTLPLWVGQVMLQGMDTEMINAVAVGRVYHSPVQLFPGNMTPPRMRVRGRQSQETALKLLSGLQRLRAEVWVATCEADVAYIEIIDVLAKPAKVRQRFVVRPKCKKILCMKSIPGVVEESKDFTDSSILSQHTSWVEASFLGPQQADCTQSMIVGGSCAGEFGRKRPSSAPQRRRTFGGDYMGSSPDLSSCSEPGPLELFASGSSRVQPQATTTRPHLESSLATECFAQSLSTINESDYTPTNPPPIIVTSERTIRQNGIPKIASLAVTDEEVDFEPQETNSSFVTSTEGQDSKYKEVTSTPISATFKPKQPLPISPLHKSSTSKPPSSSDLEDPLVQSESNVPILDTPDSRGEQKRQGDRNGTDPVMWIVTDSNTLYFYPTTSPSHKPFNSVKLHSRAVCIEYIKDKVFIGHADSTLSVYYVDEFSHAWDVENPERIPLPSPNVNEVYEVRCIAEVKDRVWVGAGPSIFFLDAEHPASREGSIFVDSWRRKPRQILPLGDIVVVTTTSTCLYILDAGSAQLIQKININSIAKLLDLPVVSDPRRIATSSHTTPAITRVVSDDVNLYIGTSFGRMVAVPITSLNNLRSRSTSGRSTPVDFSCDLPRSVTLSPTRMVGTNSPNRELTASPQKSSGEDEADGLLNRRKRDTKRGKKGKDVLTKDVKSTIEEEWEEIRTAEAEDIDGPYLENTALSLHSLNDSEVLNLVHLQLPENQVSKLKTPTDPVPYHSMPNLSSPFGGRVPISPPIVTYKTVILAAGKGHVEFITEEDQEAIDESVSSALRERNESFQLLTWGHKNVLP